MKNSIYGLFIFLFFQQSVADKTLLFSNEINIFTENDSLVNVNTSGLNKMAKTIGNLLRMTVNNRCKVDSNQTEFPVEFIFNTLSYGDYVFENKYIYIQFDRDIVLQRIRYTSTCNAEDTSFSESALKKIAKDYLKNILLVFNKEKEFEDYDSLTISNMDNTYFLRFYCKNKTDVYDNRNVELSINKNKLNIISYIGDIYQKYDINYKPQISKNDALGRIAKKYDIRISDITVDHMYLCPVKRFGKEHWVWSTSMHIQKGEYNLFVFLYLDCSTGEINVMNN